MTKVVSFILIYVIIIKSFLQFNKLILNFEGYPDKKVFILVFETS